MQNNDTRSTPTPAATLSAPQVADRMGLTTRQLQDLRLRGIGPPIVQRGLSIHYLPADVQDIERHEAAMLIEQVLASIFIADVGLHIVGVRANFCSYCFARFNRVC